jgi:class 3 adenylate cyclase
MRYNGIAPRFALGEHDNRVTMPELAPEDGLSLKFPIVQTNDPSTKSAAMTDTGLLKLTGLHPSADLELVLEPAHLCRGAWVAYERSQYLLTIVRPFLCRTTWAEAVKIVRRGGRALPTETHEASILWVDVAGFTELVDSHPLDEVLSALNVYLDRLTQLVYRYHGDVNKYLGDGFLSVFDNADDAVQAACAIQQAAADFNRHQLAWGGLVFPTRIGIASGQIAVVSLGSCDRQDRTVIGMAVNLAKRLQEKATLGRIWLSQATFDRLGDQSGCRYLGPVKVKGQREPVVVYEKR